MWNNLLAIDLNALAHTAHYAFGRFLRRQDEVLLRQPVARMHNAIRDITIIREEQQSFRVAIEPTNREQPGLYWQELHDRSSVAFVASRRDKAGWLVHYHVSKRLAPNWLAVDLDLGAPGIDPRPELGHDLPVDRNPAGLNQLLGFATRSDARGGKHSL